MAIMRMTFGRRFLIFFSLTFVGLMLTSVIMVFASGTELSLKTIRITTIIQDLLVFIVPSLLSAVIFTKVPADYLCIRKRPEALITFIAIVAMICAIPAMNYIISWNESLHLPAALSHVEAWMKSSEESARKILETLMSGTSVGALIVTLLIVGVLTGFAEELYFRGGIQRLLATRPINPHIAIWITAFVFSAIHLQFFGFFPRLLLGAYFGYLLYWTGNLWIPILCHAVNNSLAVISTWNTARYTDGIISKATEKSIFDTIGTDPNMHWPWLGGSLFLTVAAIYILCKISSNPNKSINNCAKRG